MQQTIKKSIYTGNYTNLLDKIQILEISGKITVVLYRTHLTITCKDLFSDIYVKYQQNKFTFFLITLKVFSLPDIVQLSHFTKK